MVVKVLSDVRVRKEKLRRFFVIGVTLLVVALIIWLIPTVFLGSINGKIDLLELKDSPTDDDLVMLGDLKWNKIQWETAQATLFNPLATILLAIGMVLIAYGLVVRFA